MQVFSSDVYFTVGTNALLASQKEYYSDLVALVDLGHSFVVIDEHQHRNLKPNTEPVNILLSNNFIRINKNIREGANKWGNSSRLTQSFHFFMFEPIFSPVNALNQPI